MGSPLKCRISLEDVVKDISSKLGNGKRRVFILSHHKEIADSLLSELNERDRARCYTKLYRSNGYNHRPKNTKPTKYSYVIDLRDIEII